MSLSSLVRNLRRALARHQPLVEVRVSRRALLDNLHTFNSLRPGVAVAPVLKSNAYGHGLIEVAKIFDKEKIPFLAIDALFEAKQLRAAGIRNTIFILDYVRPRDIAKNKLRDVQFGIVSLTQLQELASFNRAAQIHIKIDTGMHRQGIALSEIPEALAILAKNKHLHVEGIFSHLADPVEHGQFTHEVQITNWHKGLAQVEQALPHIRFKHISATSGYAYQGQINANVARVGIGLYGIAPFLPISLTPALELATSIVEIKTIQVGDTVGYNNTFTAHGPMRLGVLPLGYYEGIDLRLSNRGSVKIKGRVCPIIGRVSMNLTSVDITNIPDVAVGEPVTVISSTVGDPNSIQKLAEMCGTIAYEPLVHIPQHLRRKIV